MLLEELHHAFMSGGANVGVLTSMVAELAAEDPLTLSTSPHVSLLLDHVAAVVTTRGGCSGTSGSGGSASGGDSTDDQLRLGLAVLAHLACDPLVQDHLLRCHPHLVDLAARLARLAGRRLSSASSATSASASASSLSSPSSASSSSRGSRRGRSRMAARGEERSANIAANALLLTWRLAFRADVGDLRGRAALEGWFSHVAASGVLVAGVAAVTRGDDAEDDDDRGGGGGRGGEGAAHVLKSALGTLRYAMAGSVAVMDLVSGLCLDDGGTGSGSGSGFIEDREQGERGAMGRQGGRGGSRSGTGNSSGSGSGSGGGGGGAGGALQRRLVRLLKHPDRDVMVLALSVLALTTLSRHLGSSLFSSHNVHQTFALIFDCVHAPVGSRPTNDGYEEGGDHYDGSGRDDSGGSGEGEGGHTHVTWTVRLACVDLLRDLLVEPRLLQALESGGREHLRPVVDTTLAVIRAHTAAAAGGDGASRDKTGRHDARIRLQAALEMLCVLVTHSDIVADLVGESLALHTGEQQTQAAQQREGSDRSGRAQLLRLCSLGAAEAVHGAHNLTSTFMPSITPLAGRSVAGLDTGLVSTAASIAATRLVHLLLVVKPRGGVTGGASSGDGSCGGSGGDGDGRSGRGGQGGDRVVRRLNPIASALTEDAEFALSCFHSMVRTVGIHLQRSVALIRAEERLNESTASDIASGIAAGVASGGGSGGGHHHASSVSAAAAAHQWEKLRHAHECSRVEGIVGLLLAALRVPALRALLAQRGMFGGAAAGGRGEGGGFDFFGNTAEFLQALASHLSLGDEEDGVGVVLGGGGDGGSEGGGVEAGSILSRRATSNAPHSLPRGTTRCSQS